MRFIQAWLIFIRTNSLYSNQPLVCLFSTSSIHNREITFTTVIIYKVSCQWFCKVGGCLTLPKLPVKFRLLDYLRLKVEAKKSNKRTCKKCFKEIRFSFSIKDEIWNKLPKKWRDSILCIECFLGELEKEAPDQKIGLTDFYFLGIVGIEDFDDSDPPKSLNGFGGTFIDNDYRKDQRIFLSGTIINIK